RHPAAVSGLCRACTAARPRRHGRPAAGRRADVGAELRSLSGRRDVAAVARLRAAGATWRLIADLRTATLSLSGFRAVEPGPHYRGDPRAGRQHAAQVERVLEALG